MHYYLGVAYSKGNALDKAVAHLRPRSPATSTDEDARYPARVGARSRGPVGARRAREYERFATAHPQSPSRGVRDARGARTLARMPAHAPAVERSKPATRARTAGAAEGRPSRQQSRRDAGVAAPSD